MNPRRLRPITALAGRWRNGDLTYRLTDGTTWLL
jgi:hypothetical protein